MRGGRVSGFAIGLGGLAILVAVPVLLIARLHDFDGLYGQDSFAYAGYALGPLRDALLRGHAPPDFPLPPGYPLLVTLASFAVGPSEAVAQAVSSIAGATIPALVALLAREIDPDRDARRALIAGLVAAVAGQLWQSSLVAMADTTGAAAATLGAIAAVRFHRSGGGRWLVVAAAAFALAAEARVIYAVVGLAFSVLAAARWRRDLRVEPRRALVAAALAGIAALVVLGPAIAAIWSAAAAGRPIPFAAEFGVAAFDPLTPFRSSFQTADGHLAYAWPMVAWYVAQPAQPYWLAAMALAIPVGLVARLRRRGLGAVDAATLLAWPGLVSVILVFYPYQNPRFFLALLPPLAILAAIGLEAGYRAIGRTAPRLRALALVLAAVAFGASAGLAWRYTDGFASRQSADLAAIRSLATEIPPGAPIASIGATAVLRHDGRAVTELYNLSPAAAAALARGPAIYVIVQREAMMSQWVGTTTGRAFAVIASAPGFAFVDRAGGWTLYAGD